MIQTSSAMHIAGAWDIEPPRGWRARWRRLITVMVSWLYVYCGWVALRDLALAALGRSRVVVVYYHRIGWVDSLSKPVGAFRADLAYLKRHYECLTLRQLVERMQSGRPLRRKLAVVSFDDGYRDNYLSAFPELKRAGVPATIFIATGYIGMRRAFPHDVRALQEGFAAREDWEKLSWDELREMQDAGIEIGSHTIEHINLGMADEQTICRELRGSLQQIQEQLGAMPRAFCFPWGKGTDISATAVVEIRAAGYYAAVTTKAGSVRAGDDVMTLRRIDAGNGHRSHIATIAQIEGFGCGRLARPLRK